MAGARGFTQDEAAATAEQRAYRDRRAAAAAEHIARRRRSREGGGDAPAFTHLSVRSCYSMRDGAIRPRELAAAAAAAGMTHVGLTDRDGLYGAVRMARAAEEEGVTPVLGTDLALAPDLERPGWGITRAGRDRHGAGDRRRSTDDPRSSRPSRGPAFLEDDAPRVIFLARTTAGYGDVCRLVSRAHGISLSSRSSPGRDRQARVVPDPPPRGAPHLPWEQVGTAAGHGGVLALLGFDSPVGRLLAGGRRDAAEAELRRWLEVLGRDAVLLGVRNHLSYGDPADPTVPSDDVRIRRTLELAEKLDVTAVATNDVRYLREDDAVLADVLRCVRHQVPLGRHNLGRRSAEAWFTTAAEMHDRFRERPDLLRNAHEVAVSCEVDLALGEVHVPRLTGLADEVAAGELHRRCWQGVGERFPRVTPRIRDRLERELDMVDRLGLHDYFLTVAGIMEGVRELGIMAACRGSAAGSLVCYALRISDVDPLAHDLAFERFMNPYRDELPDIDVDVESHRREDVYDLVMARYGEGRTACVAMVETFQARMAIREVGKVLGLPPDEIGHVAKAMPHARARDVRRVVENLPELQGSRIDAGQLETLLTIVERIDGFPRHLALHPCGILLADTSLTDRTPLERSAPRGDGHPGYAMSQHDKDDVAALGMLKLDVLGVRMLSAMRHALDMIPHTRGHELEIGDIPHGDEETYELIRSTRTTGMFQIESPGQQELIGRLKPGDLGDLVTEISLFRPGPVKADMVTPFVRRRHGEEPEAYAHPALEPVLRETHGVIVYHEQVMGALAALTGCDLSYADLLRRRLGDEDRLPAMRAWVLARARDRGFSTAEAEQVWRQIASFASFGFCKAHAAAFAVPTYRSAYLKAHYLPELMAGILTHDPGMYPRRLILDECRTFGVAVLPADVNRSQRTYTVEVIDEGHADRLLDLGDGELPPGWRRSNPRTRPLPPSGFDAGEAGGGYRYAVRIGLQDVKGITDEEIDSLLEGRPFTSLEDLRARSSLSRPTAERLAEVGALDHIGGLTPEWPQPPGYGRSEPPDSRRVLRLTVEEMWRDGRRRRAGAGRGEQTSLDLHVDHTPQLPAPTDAEQVRAELAATGLDVSRHVVSFYEPLLEALDVVRAADLEEQPTQRRVRVAGVKVAVQSPAQRSGQRVLFLTLDDRTGTAQVTYFQSALPDCAWTVRHAWLLVAEGRVSRRGSGPRGVTVTGMRAWDLSRLWRAWQEGWLPDALAERGTPAPHERAPRRPPGLAAAEFGRGSRG